MYNLDIEGVEKNPLTGLSNFFALLNADVDQTYGNEGIVTVMDIVRFSEFNHNYGKASGDNCLKIVAETLEDASSKCNKISLFHTTGDEFTMVFKGYSLGRTNEIIESVENKLKNTFDKFGYKDLSFHQQIVPYYEKISSISDFYKLQFKNRNEAVDKYSSETIFDDIMRRYEKNIKDALEKLEVANKFALTDDVSGLKNNRAANQYLNNIKMQRDDDANIALLFIDGDNLKRYNTVSYQAGNQMIRDLSNLLLDSLREEDKVFRWLSGDEFMVILHDTTKEEAKILAERIRKHVEDSTKSWIFPVTISTGVSIYPDDSNCIDTTIKYAEESNSIAKRTGKNKVVLWNELMTT